MAMRTYEDYIGHRITIISGKYRSKKGTIISASVFGIYVDLDYKPLRIMVTPCEIMILGSNGDVDKIQ